MMQQVLLEWWMKGSVFLRRSWIQWQLLVVGGVQVHVLRHRFPVATVLVPGMKLGVNVGDDPISKDNS
jgi:hypothetical protein